MNNLFILFNLNYKILPLISTREIRPDLIRARFDQDTQIPTPQSYGDESIYLDNGRPIYFPHGDCYADKPIGKIDFEVSLYLDIYIVFLPIHLPIKPLI